MMEDTSMNIWNFFKWLLKRMRTTALLQKSSWFTQEIYRRDAEIMKKTFRR